MPETRRRIIKFFAASGLVSLLSCRKSTPPPIAEVQTPAPDQLAPPAATRPLTFGAAALPKAKGPRVVVIGGGVSGLSMAKYLKIENPAFDIVLVERRAAYVACYGSALWYAERAGLEIIAGQSFYDAARHGGYVFFQACCLGLDRTSRTVSTDQGDIHYDYAVVAPGVDYDYEKLGVTDARARIMLEQYYPAGFVSPAEYTALKHKLDRFNKGVFIQTVPAGNYRCFASPFERACVLAAMIKKKKRPAKVLLLDASPEIRIKKEGFDAAFKELYGGIVEYVPSVVITGIDPAAREITTEFDSYRFDDAAIYPPVRGSRLLERLGLMDKDSAQKEARIDPLTNQLREDDRVYVTGDSRPMPFSKSANTAHTEARYVAKLIAARAQNNTIPWQSPTTKCFSVVNLEPLQGISVETQYRYNEKEQAFEFDHSKADENRDAAKAQAVLDWVQALHRDLFGV